MAINLCDNCGIRKPKGMYRKAGITKQLCMYCLTKLYPDISQLMIETSRKIEQQYRESYEEKTDTPIIDRLPLIAKSDRYPIMNIIFCRTCNFYPVSNLPSMKNPVCKRCGDKLHIVPAHMKAVGINSYITSERAN